MKKIKFLLAFLFMGVCFANAQVKTPQPSPSASLDQTVGLTEVSIDYSRPGVKEREIFGGLVPYGEIWRTGANKNTTISFSTDVKINGETLEKGTYAIYTKPGEENWAVYFYTDSENWGTPEKWDESKVALKTMAKVNKLPFKMESFTIMLNDLKNNSAGLNFIWENTMASLDLEVPTEKTVMNSIEQTMAGEPKMEDYFAAATYYLHEGKDMEQALKWINKAVEMNDDAPFYMLRYKSLIQAELGMKKDAIATAKLSLEKAEKAGSDHYIRLNKKSLKEWGAM